MTSAPNRFRISFLIVTALFIISVLGTFLIVPRTTPLVNAAELDQSLPVPTNLKMVQDDRAAILSWDLGQSPMVGPLPGSVTGFKVTWGPADNPTKFEKLTERPIIQLQPLENGKPYVAWVQSVDSMGRLSAATARQSFTGDETRVKRLRETMNGIFDDFNLPEGLPNELKWNTAYSLCNDANANGYFINSQYHVHNTIVSETCDRSQNVNRARAILDLTDNGTRTIVFDFDGVHQRNKWYLDLVPKRVDLLNPERFIPGTVRLQQEGQNVSLWLAQSNGELKELVGTGKEPYSSLEWAKLEQVPNVRRFWVMKLSQNRAEVIIDGKTVLLTPPNSFQLSHKQFHVQWNVFSYNTPKANQPFVLAHWDNFGFDAPAGSKPTIVTHNYRLTNLGTDMVSAHRGNNAPPVVTLKIPDTIDGAVARRLMFTLQMKDFSQYEWAAEDRVLINGRSFSIAKPDLGIPGLELGQIVGIITPYSMLIDVPEGVFQKGDNKITFDLKRSDVHNIHAEFDFPIGSAPTFTQPGRVALGGAFPATPPIGPEAQIAKIGPHALETWKDDIFDRNKFAPEVKGTIKVEVNASNRMVLEGAGSNPGIANIDLLIDRKFHSTIKTNTSTPAPAGRYTFTVDTTKLPNGKREFYVVAYSPNCVPSIAMYGGGNEDSGKYVAITVTVNNPGARTQAELDEVATTDLTAPSETAVLASVDLAAAPQARSRMLLPMILGPLGAGCKPSTTLANTNPHDH